MRFDPAIGFALIRTTTPYVQTYDYNNEWKDDSLGVEIRRTRSLPNSVPFREDDICAGGRCGAKCSGSLCCYR